MISADYSGLCADVVQRIRGERFMATFVDEASGDVIMFDAMRARGRAPSGEDGASLESDVLTDDMRLAVSSWSST